jgi:hypothetical protein
LKAYFRGALASLTLQLYSQGLYFANGGLSIDGENNDIRKLLSELEKRHAPQQGLRAKKIENEEESKKPKLKYRWRD